MGSGSAVVRRLLAAAVLLLPALAFLPAGARGAVPKRGLATVTREWAVS